MKPEEEVRDSVPFDALFSRNIHNSQNKSVLDTLYSVYALEWDPQNHYMKSWFFHRNEIPENLQQSIETASFKKSEERTMPDTHSWGAPYAYFAIGDTTGCSANHL